MASGVFSLKKVYTKQVQNVINNNFASWPESAIYGYFGGGFSSPNYFSTISRLDFSSEAVSNPGKNFTSARSLFAAVSSSSYGYFGGGLVPSGVGPTYINTISRLDFSNETVSNPGKNLPTARSGLSAVSNNFYGYFGGGLPPTSLISRLDFSNETVSNPGNNLPPATRYLAGTSSNSYGYFGGGYTFPPTTWYNTITRLDFSNETVSDPGNNLPFGRSYFAGTSSNSYGYFGGGSTPTIVNTISRLDFSNETVSNPGNNLLTARANLAGTSSNSYGYFAGGYHAPGTPPVTYINTISRLDFSNETVSDPGNNLPTSRASSAALSGGASVRLLRDIGYKTYGYNIGGNVGSSHWTRLEFSTDTATSKSPTPAAKTWLSSGVANDNYGYITGQYPSPESDILRKLDFSTEDLTISPQTFIIKRYAMVQATSKLYGYLGGGYLSPTGPARSNLARIDYSNETLSLRDPAGIFKRYSNCASTNKYGYFIGGLSSPTTLRLDFSSETTNYPGMSIGGVFHAGVIGNDRYAYVGGGEISTEICSIKRINFDTETVTDIGKGLYGARSELEGLSSNTDGYFCGGAPLTHSYKVEKFNFADNTQTNLGNILHLFTAGVSLENWYSTSSSS